jgi:predicted transcriptional regulator
MKVWEIMSRDVEIASPPSNRFCIARRMADEKIGFMPVGGNDRLIGTVTDRHLVVRGLDDTLGSDASILTM